MKNLEQYVGTNTCLTHDTLTGELEEFRLEPDEICGLIEYHTTQIGDGKKKSWATIRFSMTDCPQKLQDEAWEKGLGYGEREGMLQLCYIAKDSISNLFHLPSQEELVSRKETEVTNLRKTVAKNANSDGEHSFLVDQLAKAEQELEKMKAPTRATNEELQSLIDTIDAKLNPELTEARTILENKLIPLWTRRGIDTTIESVMMFTVSRENMYRHFNRIAADLDYHLKNLRVQWENERLDENTECIIMTTV